MNSIEPRNWVLQSADKTAPKVAASRATEADKIDTNHDGVCSDAEIETYMRAQRLIKPPPAKSDVAALVSQFKTHLQGGVSIAAQDYRSLDQITGEMQQLVKDHPDRAQMVSIAKTSEGRDVWALKVSSGAAGDTSAKPGVVITGTHHAREWMTPEVTLQLAEDLVNNYDTDANAKRRLDNAELWFIPVVNPDGFQYTRDQDNMWRKNRVPISGAACPTDPTQPLPPSSLHAKPGDDPIAYGIDLNRNYWDGNPDHMKLFRADGDKPCITSDDYGASDDPNDETFRGMPGSEPEVQGLMKLEYTHANIKGVLDHHSYGEELLRPWGHIADPPADVKDYDEVGALMVAAQGDHPYTYLQSFDDYPTLGSSETCHEANGRMNFTIEMGTSFQPTYDEFADTYKAVGSADLAFIDWIIGKNTPPPAPPAPAPPAPAPPTSG